MGSDISLELREQNLMTKIMLKDEDQIIEHIEEEKMEINRPINQVSPPPCRWAILSCTTPPTSPSRSCCSIC